MTGEYFSHRLKLSYHRSDNSLDDAVLYEDRFHGAVCGLETNAVSFSVKSFERGERVVQKRHDYFTVTRTRVAFDDDEITIQNSFFDHTATFYAQDIRVGAVEYKVSWNGHGLIILYSFDWFSRRDES